MSLTYGFYNSVNHDRKYNAEQLSSLFNGIINDGVFFNIGNAFAVKATSGMSLTVDEGRAWFNGTWTNNDSEIPITISQSEAVLHRIDIVALEVNSSIETRANSIKVIQGTPSSSPVPPTLTRNNTVNQYPIAHVYVKAGTSVINQADITNKVGTSDCPFITSILETTNIDYLLLQWNNEFDLWLNTIKGKLGNDVAGNLQYQIDELNNVIGNGDIDCGGFTDIDPSMLDHFVDVMAHQNVYLDANMDENVDDTTTLEAHKVNTYSHGNILVDGNFS
jgi:hypothetical protein